MAGRRPFRKPGNPVPGEEVSVSDAPRQDSSETRREKSAEAPAEKSDVRADKHRPAPAASAVPEGSSQPSLLPPVTERRQLREDDGNEEEGSPRRPQQTTPQVRVISRPDPAQQARVVSRPAPGDGRTPRDDRPSRRFASRRSPPRSAAAPGGPRPGGPRPGGSRPGASGAPGGFPPPMPQPGAEGEQSRRKRGKSRRTVDFPQDGGEDFARRKNIGLPGMDDDEGAFRSRSRSRKPKKQQAAPGRHPADEGRQAQDPH